MSDVINELPSDVSVLYYKVDRQIVDDFNLNKSFILDGAISSILPADVVRKYNDIDEKRILEQHFGDSIIYFINFIKSNIPDSDLTIFYNNFNNIKTSVRKFGLSNVLLGKRVAAQWIPIKNTIELSKHDYKSTINHELFHVATTYIDQETNMIYCGFQQIENENKQIGEGLNEGYTQFLTEKFFPDSLKSYKYEKSIAEAVELIVGQEIMQSLYFNANLQGLINVLSRYDSLDNIYKFITDLDFLNKHLCDKKYVANSCEIVLDTLKRVNLFIVQNFTKKIIMDNGIDKPDIKELIMKVLPLLTVVPNKITLNGKSIVIVDDYTTMNSIYDIYFCFESQNKNKNIL